MSQWKFWEDRVRMKLHMMDVEMRVLHFQHRSIFVSVMDQPSCYGKIFEVTAQPPDRITKKSHLK
jgi:hypothetical protein